MTELFEALTRNPEIPSSSPLPAGHAGVNSLLASLPASWGFNSYKLKNPVHLGMVCYCFHPLHGTKRVICHVKIVKQCRNAMIDYSMVKCKLMDPRIGTGYTFSE